MTKFVCDECGKVYADSEITIEGHYGSGIRIYCDYCWNKAKNFHLV